MCAVPSMYTCTCSYDVYGHMILLLIFVHTCPQQTNTFHVMLFPNFLLLGKLHVLISWEAILSKVPTASKKQQFKGSTKRPKTTVW